MPDSQLKIAVLGLDDGGKLLLQAAAGEDYFNIVAVADNDAKVAEQTAAQYNCTPYDDYRQLIIANQLDCLLVAAPFHCCAEYIKIAIKRKFNILKLPPLARNFAEAAEFVKLAQAEKISFTIANLGRFAQSSLALRNFIEQNRLEQVFLILAAASQPGLAAPAWRSDPLLAGGGAVLYDCWEIIDQILCNFAVPQQVYCITTNTARDRQQRLYLAEDSAVITIKFSDALFGNLLAGRAAGPPGTGPQKWLQFHAKDMLLVLCDQSFDVSDPQGRRIHRAEFHDDQLSRTKNLLENFASSLLWPDKNPLVSTAAENLKNMAFIEAAYLSARTGMPEEPARILKIS